MTGGRPAWSLPPGDLAARHLPLIMLPAGEAVVRIHRLGAHPHYFGLSQPRHRFDDPDGGYGVCYLGLTDEAAFVETVLRNQYLCDLSYRDLARLALAVGTLRRPVRLVEFGGRGLRQLRTVAGTVHASYRVTQRWSRALWEHPDGSDGILYRSRFDNDLRCIALFDRARRALAIQPGVPLTSQPDRLGPILDRYDLALHD